MIAAVALAALVAACATPSTATVTAPQDVAVCLDILEIDRAHEAGELDDGERGEAHAALFEQAKRFGVGVDLLNALGGWVSGLHAFDIDQVEQAHFEITVLCQDHWDL